MQDIIVVAPQRERYHPMWFKMWERAGQDPNLIPFTPLENPRIPAGATVITMGEYALNRILGEHDLFRWRGRAVKQLGGRWVVPTLCPSDLLPRKGEDEDEDGPRSPLAHKPTRFQGTWVFDVTKALRGQFVDPDSLFLDYTIDPRIDVWEKWVQDCLDANLPISFDIETQYKMKVTDEEEFEEEELPIGAILRISFSYKPHHAVSVSWSQQYMPGIIALLKSNVAKICWNGILFDIPRLREEGIDVKGDVWDMQDGWHMIESDQPKGLEYVTSFYTPYKPWKHLNTANPGLYSCIDSDGALINAMGIIKDLHAYNMWDLFNKHCVQLMPIVNESGRRGNLIDVIYGADLEKELWNEKIRMEAEVQNFIPPHLFPRKRFKRKPEDEPNSLPRKLEPIVFKGTGKICSHCNQPVSNKSEHFKGGKKNNPCKAAGAEIVEAIVDITEWDEIFPFNPNSSDQIKDYVSFNKHPLGKNRKTGADSCDSKQLKKLAKKYGKDFPIYDILVEYKKVAKTISTYIYKPDQLGLIYTTYVNGPSTWRFASRNINLQNVGKRESNKWAKKARKQIIARPGHCFVQADSTSIEAVVVGYLIGDENFIRMAGKSIHAWLCCQDLGWEFTDENIKKVKEEHKGLYNKMKTAIYLLLYGGDPYLMYMTEPETFHSTADAKAVQDKIFALIPKLKEWQERTREIAKREGVLTSPWGYRHRFFDVYTFKKGKDGKIEHDPYGHPIIKLGQDGKRCLAFLPQNCAGAFGRDNLLAIGQSQWREYMPANVFVHDGYTLEVPEDKKYEAAQFLIDLLTRPIPELGGLRIGCEVELGYNWSDWDPVENPNGLKVWKKVETV